MTDAALPAKTPGSSSPIVDLPFTMPTVERVRAHYAPLCAAARMHFGGPLAGRFVLVDRLSREGDALLIAASVAGAASLTLETRPAAIRHCVRNGIVDFAVNNLDEALRILKNEIRKQQPIAVLLEREPAAVLSQMVERGAQPEMLRWPSAEAAPAAETDIAIALLRQRGALPVPDPVEGMGSAAEVVCWRAGDGGSAVLRELDRLAAETIPADDWERQNWVTRAPRYLPRALRLERCVSMSEAEAKLFLTAVSDSAREDTLVRRIEVEVAARVHVFEGKS